MTVSLTTKVGALRVTAGDNIAVSYERFGWSNKVFEVLELTINPDLSVSMLLKETAADIYDFPVDEDVDRDLSPNTSLPSPFSVAPPTGFGVSETTTVDADGTVFPSATLTWDRSPSGSIANIELEYKDTGSADFLVLGRFSNTVGEYDVLEVEAQKTYNFRARHFNNLGVYSGYASASLYIEGDTIAPQTPTNIVATGATGSFTVTWTNPAVDADYKHTLIYLGTSATLSSAVKQGAINGTTWSTTVASGTTFYAWLQNEDTSGNLSATSSYVYGFANGIAQGMQGPSGSSGNVEFRIYKRSDTTPSTPTGNVCALMSKGIQSLSSGEMR
jgi:hypothetical protein